MKRSGFIKRKGFLVLLIVGQITYLQSCANHPSREVTVVKTAKTLEVQVHLPPGVQAVEIQLHSDRNTRISCKSDVSWYDPVQKEAGMKSVMWYPVVDVVVEEAMEGIIEFSENSEGICSINGFNNKALDSIKPVTVIPGNRLMFWENSLCVNPSCTIRDFYLSSQVNAPERNFHHRFTLLSNKWSGTVSVVSVQGSTKQLVGSARVEGNVERRVGALKKYAGGGISKERVLESLKATVGFTLRCQDKTAESKTNGGLNLFYDLEAKTYRRPHWIWGWGPSIKLLIDASHIKAINRWYEPELLRQTALQVVETSRRFQMKDPVEPTYGIITSRWREAPDNLTENGGFEEFYSVADALFLVGWGWMPAYRESHDKTLLADAQVLINTTAKLLKTFEIIPMDYMVYEKRWKTFTINEAGFGPEGIAEVYLETGDHGTYDTGKIYMDRLLSKFQRADGLWQRKYNIDTKESIPTLFHTRGQGWAMEGLLASYSMHQDSIYLRYAEMMAQTMMKWQQPSGCWNYTFTEPEEKVGISEKGTALWCLLFYRLYGYTGNQNHLSTARKALVWCMDHQYVGDDSEAYGSIVGISPQSGVTYRNWFPLSCVYTSGFFGLALLEEMKLLKDRNPVTKR